MKHKTNQVTRNLVKGAVKDFINILMLNCSNMLTRADVIYINSNLWDLTVKICIISNFVLAFYQPANSQKQPLKFVIGREETNLALIALSHDMYKYIMNKVFAWGINEPVWFSEGAFLFLFYKNLRVDANNHNVPEFTTIAELDSYSWATNEELQKIKRYSGKL